MYMYIGFFSNSFSFEYFCNKSKVGFAILLHFEMPVYATSSWRDTYFNNACQLFNFSVDEIFQQDGPLSVWCKNS